MGLGLILGAAAGLGAVGSSIFGSYLNNKTQNKWAEKNFDQQERMFDYQKYLNNNQMQMQAADAQAAGINPLAMSGGSLSGGSYSNVASPEVDTSGIANALSQLASLKNERDIANKHNATQTDIASNQVEAQKYATDKDYEARQAQIESQQRIAMEKIASEERIALGKRTSDESIASANRLSSEKIASANRQSNEKMHSERLDLDTEIALNRAARENHITKQEARDRYLSSLSQAWELYNLIEQGTPASSLKGRYAPEAFYVISAFSTFVHGANKDVLKGKSKQELFDDWFKQVYNFEEFKPDPINLRRRGN